MATSLSARVTKAVNPIGKWVTTIKMTKYNADMIDVTYTITKDSLYIDTYPSGCPIAQMSVSNFIIEGDNFSFDAIDTLYDIYKGHKVHERIYHLFFKKIDGSNQYRVMRDDTLVDVIKKIP